MKKNLKLKKTDHKSLNPHERNNRIVFGEKCEEFLNSTPIKNEFKSIEMSEDREKTELKAKDTTFIPQKKEKKNEIEKEKLDAKKNQ